MQFYDAAWKYELSTFIKELLDAAQKVTEETPRLFAVERPLFYSAFVVRKLIEDNGVTAAIKSAWVKVDSHASTREGRELFFEIIAGALNVEDHFDLARSQNLRISYIDLASEIIHSDGLIWDSETTAFAVFSYRNRLKRLLKVPVHTYVAMLEKIVADEPTTWRIEKDLRTGRITNYAI